MTKEKEQFTGVRAKFASHKEKNSGSYDHILPKSGVIATIPSFMNHGSWMKAQRQAGGDLPKAQAAFIVEVVLFEGEKLTIADVSLLIDAKDMLSLIGEVFGDEDDESDNEGND